MQVTILREEGINEALLGLGLSYGLTSGVSLKELEQDQTLLARLNKIAAKQVERGGSHCKFLESIIIWLDITAPRYWWQECSTYRAPQDGEDGFMPSGITTQSESTMHTILDREIVQADFALTVPNLTLVRLNILREAKKFKQLKVELGEGFLQRRIICTNYKVLHHIYQQRWRHRLVEWLVFCAAMGGLEHAGWVLE